MNVYEIGKAKGIPYGFRTIVHNGKRDAKPKGQARGIRKERKRRARIYIQNPINTFRKKNVKLFAFSLLHPFSIRCFLCLSKDGTNQPPQGNNGSRGSSDDKASR